MEGGSRKWTTCHDPDTAFGVREHYYRLIFIIKYNPGYFHNQYLSTVTERGNHVIDMKAHDSVPSNSRSGLHCFDNVKAFTKLPSSLKISKLNLKRVYSQSS